MGVTLSAAGSLQWYHDTLTPNDSFDTIVAESEKAACISRMFLRAASWCSGGSSAIAELSGRFCRMAGLMTRALIVAPSSPSRCR